LRVQAKPLMADEQFAGFRSQPHRINSVSLDPAGLGLRSRETVGKRNKYFGFRG
jgi:hypothetical protein